MGKVVERRKGVSSVLLMRELELLGMGFVCYYEKGLINDSMYRNL